MSHRDLRYSRNRVRSIDDSNIFVDLSNQTCVFLHVPILVFEYQIHWNINDEGVPDRILFSTMAGIEALNEVVKKGKASKIKDPSKPIGATSRQTVRSESPRSKGAKGRPQPNRTNPPFDPSYHPITSETPPTASTNNKRPHPSYTQPSSAPYILRPYRSIYTTSRNYTRRRAKTRLYDEVVCG